MNKGCIISLIVVVGLASIGLGFYFTQQNKKEKSSIEFEKPEIGDIIEKTIATGVINPRQEVDIKPQVSGVVDKLYIEEGDLVTKGQELAKIKLIPSEVSINSAKSNVELARIRYDESQRELDRQRKIYDGSLDVADAKLSYENSKIETERQRQLFEDDVISKQEYERYQLDLDLKRTAYENAQISSENSLMQYESEVSIRKQELDAAVNNLQLLREGMTRNSGQVSNIITSTLDGMVLDIPVKEGSSVVERNNFNEGTSIAVIANMSDLIFEGKVDESDVGKLRAGMQLELNVGAIADKTFNAVLEHISPKGIVEEGSVKFEVRASITTIDTSTLLRAGYSANGDIILETKNGIVTVNERDIIYRGDTTLVEIQTGDAKYEGKIIELGISDGIRTEIVSGLDTTQAIRVRNTLDDN